MEKVIADVVKPYIDEKRIIIIADNYIIDEDATLKWSDIRKVMEEYTRMKVEEQRRKDAAFASGVYYSRHECGIEYLKKFEDSILSNPLVSIE